jgi:xanthine dehydrogenase accessory factor
MLRKVLPQDQSLTAPEPIPNSDDELLEEALRWHQGGKSVAIATVIGVSGSASRAVGSVLIVDENGAFLGSVSAGCVEAEVITAALNVIEMGLPCVLEFGATEGVWQAGIPCGKITVYVEPLM